MDYLKTPVGELAAAIPGATRLFRQHRIDFCCGGDEPLEQALAVRRIDPTAFTEALAGLAAPPVHGTDWRAAPLARLIEHIVESFHERHRRQLPELLALARKVEQVHERHPACPRGLAGRLAALQGELESHMQKEERVLFPLILQGDGNRVTTPVSVMRYEHDQHGLALAQIRAAAHDLVLPADACATWRACYQGLEQLISDLMEHIHLENNVLFPRAIEQV
ncbi:iron-sulfur cluster repair protein YtfE [Pelomicrobium sp.]|jgi:regulator of cell morphogenesis and NO signaling|uniref:iron-sulfur cluster repair protein YtfE n=1 Tax=Pelomicrobium sp. TaxID=2815319 RepID=UPI002FDDDA95